MKDTFTTGQVARICRMSTQTAIRCIDQGLLRGYRVPGSTFRRVTVAALARFIAEQGLPRDLLDAEIERRVAAAAPPPEPDQPPRK